MQEDWDDVEVSRVLTVIVGAFPGPGEGHQDFDLWAAADGQRDEEGYGVARV